MTELENQLLPELLPECLEALMILGQAELDESDHKQLGVQKPGPFNMTELTDQLMKLDFPEAFLSSAKKPAGPQHLQWP